VPLSSYFSHLHAVRLPNCPLGVIVSQEVAMLAYQVSMLPRLKGTAVYT